MEAAAGAVGTSVTKVAGAPTRAILNVLRQRGRLTRPQLFAETPRELIPSITRLSRHLQTLVEQKRIKAFLPTGRIYGKDHFAYKLNPTRRAINFPELYGKKAHRRHLNNVIENDVTGTLRGLVEETPEPANIEFKRLKQTIAEAKKDLL
jgi:hypothetical protein